jgi:hypothetical protein
MAKIGKGVLSSDAQHMEPFKILYTILSILQSIKYYYIFHYQQLVLITQRVIN